MSLIHLDPALVPAKLRGAYNGHKFKAIVGLTVDLPATAGLWSGGSREFYKAVSLLTGEVSPLIMQDQDPWGLRQDHKVTTKPGFAVVLHSIFCGEDMGLTFYIHPDNAATLLPTPVELTPYEKLILIATRSLKSSYGGRDRYEMARDEYHCTKALAGQPYPTRAQWNETKTVLVGKGLLDKRGAITVKGRNAI